MALEIDSGEFEDFVENPSTELFLEWAMDLFSLATGITEMPEDPTEVRLVNRALFQMAWYLRTDWENREAYMTEMSSERIGSYSYSKMQKTIADNNGPTNIPAFDLAVEYFNEKFASDFFSVAWTSSENVFQNGFDPYRDAWE